MLIITEIKYMLQERHISADKLTHLEWIKQRKNGKTFSMPEHIRGMIYSLLSNNRPWEPIEENLDRIDEIFFHYDKDEILATSPDYFIEQIQLIRCGNRSIKKQMNALHGNIHTFERIEKEFGTLDALINTAR